MEEKKGRLIRDFLAGQPGPGKKREPLINHHQVPCRAHTTTDSATERRTHTLPGSSQPFACPSAGPSDCPSQLGSPRASTDWFQEETQAARRKDRLACAHILSSGAHWGPD